MLEHMCGFQSDPVVALHGTGLNVYEWMPTNGITSNNNRSLELPILLKLFLIIQRKSMTVKTVVHTIVCKLSPSWISLWEMHMGLRGL